MKKDILLAIPHILTCLILIIIFPQKWIGILIVGLLLPDFYFFLYKIYKRFFVKDPEFQFGMVNLSMKTALHIMLFVVTIFLFFNKEYVVGFSGGIHIILDLFGL
jgi:hypothetical protein